VWRTIVTGLGWCDRFVQAEPRERFRGAVRDLVRPAFARLGWDTRESDTDLDRELRGDLIRALGVLGNDPDIQERARAMEALARAGGPVDPSVASAVVDVVACVGGSEEFEVFRARADVAPTPQDQRRYRYALTRFRDPVLMERALEVAMSDAVRPQDAPFVLARAKANRDCGEIAWRFVRDRWEELTRRSAPSNVIYLAQGAFSLTAPGDVADVQAFFRDHDIPQSRLSLLQHMEQQRLMAALRSRAEFELAARFA
jgi:puromycin-sensitive aminopeptidase